MKKAVQGILLGLTLLALLTPFFIFKELLFPFITSKAYFFRIVIELAFPFYIYLLFAEKDYRPSLKNPLNISVIAFFVINLVSGIFGVDPLRSFWGNFERMGGVFYLAHLSMFYFYIVMLGQIRSDYVQKFIKSLIWVGAVLALYGFMVKITGNNFIIPDPSYPRVSATFGNPIFFASYLIVPMFITLYYLIGEKSKNMRWVYGIIAALELYSILLSQTRGAIVGLLIGLFVGAVAYIILEPSRKVKVWGGGALAGFILIIGLLFAFHNSLPKGTILSRVFNLRDSNTEARLIQWKVALTGFKDAPILGSGPESYYVVSNLHYDPEIFKYDPSWFDKPHNYLLEILVTTGVLGFIAYLGIVIFSLWALVKAFKFGLINAIEFSILLVGQIAYQIQNLFVFDTVSVSVAFFSLVGFSGFLWFASKEQVVEKKNLKYQESAIPPLVPTIVSGVLVIYILFVGNITGLQLAKAVNFGAAYTSVNPQMANQFFERAKSLPFNFDPVQSGSKYADFATNFASGADSKTMEAAKQLLDNAINFQNEVVKRVPVDPIAFQQLANLYVNKAILDKSTLDPKGLEAAQKASSLAPLRPETQFILARVYFFQQDFENAEKVMQNVVATFPTNQDAKLQLASIYANDAKIDQALTLGREVIDSGFQPSRGSQIDWIALEFAKAKQYDYAIKGFELAVSADPKNYDVTWNLAVTYAEAGQKEKAINTAESLIKNDPSNKTRYQEFINSLK